MSSSPPCFHCGLPIPIGVDFSVAIDDAPRAMCCAGCQAVAQAIVQNGLGDYYRNRESLPISPATAAQALEDLGLYDHEAVQKSFVRQLEAGEREASLILEGITCAACIWLNEQHLAKLPGVSAVSINYATRRARIRWQTDRLRLSQILQAIADIGYHAYPYDPSRQEQLALKERREALWRLFVAGFSAMQVMMYAFPAYIAGDGEMTPDIVQLMRWASLVLTLPVILYSSVPFFRNALRDLRNGRAGMDVPVAVGILVAFAASCWATLSATGEVYFDSVSMFVFLLLSGRYLELQARQKAVAQSETLARMTPAVANRLLDYPARMAVARVAAAELGVGDCVLVRPGEQIPADGQVREGNCSVDESLLTGESLPVRRQSGDAVSAGTMAGDGTLVIEVSRVGEATRLAAILRLMERAATERAPTVELADRVAAWFVAGLLLAAVCVGMAWWWVEPARALWIVVAVLVVSCPCALSLATPTALTVAHGRLAADGLLVTRSHAVASLAGVDHVVFDKTGTLTAGQLRLAEVRPLGTLSRDDCLALAAALEAVSEHPVAKAIRFAAPGDLPAIEGFNLEPGQGVEATVGGRAGRIRIGRATYVGALQKNPSPPPACWHDGPVAFLGDATGWLAVFEFSDPLREDAAATVQAVRALGIGVSILSGDAPVTVGRIANQLGITDWTGGCLPEDKYRQVKALQAQGKSVAMVGDGVNDAPVLAAATVSVAMGGGADLAKVQADCILLGAHLRPLTLGIRVARKTQRIIRQNLLWAVTYNVLALPLAALGWINPWQAGVGMSGSSLLVVLNALRLRRR